MSKVPMKRVFLCGLKEDRKQILETLQRAGVVEITAEDYGGDYLKTMDVMPQKVSFDKNAGIAQQALSVLDALEPPEDAGLLASLEDAKPIGLSHYDAEAKKAEQYLEEANQILALNRQIAEDRAGIPKAENRLEALMPWMSFDLPLSYAGTEQTAAFVGSVPPEQGMEAIYAKVQEASEEAGKKEPIAAELRTISSSKEMTCLFALCLKEDASILERALKAVNFAKAPLSDLVPQKEAQVQKDQIAALEQDIAAAEARIKTFAKERENLRFAADYYAMRAEKYGVLNRLPQSESAFFLSGYVPERYAKALQQKITGAHDAVVEITDPKADEDVPVELQNGFFADPMETVVESYSLPGKAEIDPSRIVSLFYYVFFGMMLSDAGYGLMLAGATGFVLLKVKNIKPGMKKMMKLFFYSGISTIVWGILFGSFFGDAVNVIAATFFNRPDIMLKPLWFEPVSQPMRLLVFAFGLGIIHLFTGLGIKLYTLLRQGLVKDAIYDVVFWIMFVGGGIVYLLTMSMVTDMLGLSFTLSPAVGTAAAVIAVLGAVGVVLTGGRESKNWIKRLLKGAYSAYGVTSYLSDVLSYSRLLALGLATGVIAQVFNKMGSMLGATWYGVLIFIVVFLIGHVMNLAINVLGAYVHTNRLQFVEFFGKFYEGGGKKFEPFTEHTKYFKVKEDI